MRKFTFAAFVAASLIIGSNSLYAQGVIRTIAGNATTTSTGDGDAGPALDAILSNPSGVAVDNLGNIYIADKNHYRVRRIEAATGIIMPFAGSGTFGYSGMGGPCASAELRLPDGLFIDAYNNLQISDWYNDIIFRVELGTTRISNHCGDGHQGDGGDGGQSDRAQLKIPAGSCADRAGKMYIADNGNNRIRMVVPPSGSLMVNTVYTIANGTGVRGYAGDGGPAIAAKFNSLGGVFIDPSVETDLYIADQGNHVIRKINLETGIITLVAGTPGTAGFTGDGGSALSATFNNPGNMYIDAYRHLYICDIYNNAIRMINLNTCIISTIAGNGTMGFSGDGGNPRSAQLANPNGVWVDNAGNVFISDGSNNRIREITYPVIEVGGPTATSGDPSTTAHGGTGGASVASLDIASATNANNATIFPNPSSGLFNLNVEPVQVGGRLEITNVIGVTVYTSNVSDQKSIIDLSNMASGIYTLTLRSPIGIYTQKLTVAK